MSDIKSTDKTIQFQKSNKRLTKNLSQELIGQLKGSQAQEKDLREKNSAF